MSAKQAMSDGFRVRLTAQERGFYPQGNTAGDEQRNVAGRIKDPDGNFIEFVGP